MVAAVVAPSDSNVLLCCARRVSWAVQPIALLASATPIANACILRHLITSASPMRRPLPRPRSIHTSFHSRRGTDNLTPSVGQPPSSGSALASPSREDPDVFASQDCATIAGMAQSASMSRTAHAVVRRIDAMTRHAADLERRCVYKPDQADLHDAV